VVRTLRGLLAKPAADAFLNGAIFAGRVQRVSHAGASAWRATPRPADTLSDIVLSLFVTDILSNRQRYDADLSVCDTCGRVGFETRSLVRTGCQEHPPASKPGSDSRATQPMHDARALGSRTADDEVNAVATAWSNELCDRLREWSAWPVVGHVELAPGFLGDSLGGHVDRHTIRIGVGVTAVEALAAWRLTDEGQIVERALRYANNALLQVAPAPLGTVPLDAEWYHALTAGEPIALLGAASDVLQIVRACRRTPVGGLLSPCSARGRPGVVVALSGPGPGCTISVRVSLRETAREVTVSIAVGVRSPSGGLLRRVDLALTT
jgi:hypothetical protein